MNLSQMVRKTWNNLSAYPGGKLLFSKIIGRMAPYSGSIDARIHELSPGYCKASIRERRSLRNHLNSVHALALANLGELASGLAFSFGLPDGTRGIPVKLSIDYIKKARGTITAECRCVPPTSNEERDYEIEAPLRNEAGETVAVLKAIWKISPAPKK